MGQALDGPGYCAVDEPRTAQLLYIICTSYQVNMTTGFADWTGGGPVSEVNRVLLYINLAASCRASHTDALSLDEVRGGTKYGTSTSHLRPTSSPVFSLPSSHTTQPAGARASRTPRTTSPPHSIHRAIWQPSARRETQTGGWRAARLLLPVNQTAGCIQHSSLRAPALVSYYSTEAMLTRG